MATRRSSRKAKLPTAKASNGASTSSSPKENDPIKDSKTSSSDNGSSAAADATVHDLAENSKDVVPTETTEDSTTIPGALSAAPVGTLEKTIVEPTSTNGTLEQQQNTSPKGKKRALPQSANDQESTTKKTKESPQATPKSLLKQEGSPAVEGSSAPSDQSPPTLINEDWQGFCEIENEPAFFSVILREIGVENVTVRQVLMLDPDILATMPNPIFGLILCFRHRNFDVANQEETCPSDLWFANQMPAQNSCATLAMIHTLLNTDNEDIDIGEHMRQFKDYSKDLTPFHRGQAFASWQFVKNIHNSFAKKMDKLKDDDHLAHKVHKAETAKRKPSFTLKPAPKSRARRDSSDSNASDLSKDSFEENAQHYIAFVPSGGSVWKLDGMDSFPTRIGTYDELGGESWIDAVSDRIQALMMAGGDAEYSVFAIAQSPLVGLRAEIVETDNTIKAVGARLDALSADWHAFVPAEDIEPPSPSWLGSFSEEDRAAFPVPDEVQEEIEEEGVPGLLARRAELVSEFRRLASAWTTEEAGEMEEVDLAEKRRFDLGPAIKRWLEMLAENGQLEALAGEFPARE